MKPSQLFYKKDLVSVIVPTKNSEKTIKRCLESIKMQTYPRIEIIVVDNYSEDKTREIAKKYATVYITGPERSTQRNMGALKSSGEFLLFVDSDTFLTPTVVEDCVYVIKRCDADGVIIPQRSIGEGFWAKCKALEKSIYIGDELIESVHFIKREVFFALGGYDERIAGGGEDWDLPIRMRKMGCRIGRVNSLILHDEGKLRLSNLVRKKYYYGKTIPIYVKKNPSYAFRQLNIIRPSFLRNWKLMISNPVYALGLMLMKFCELAAGAMGALYWLVYGFNVVEGSCELVAAEQRPY